MEPEVHQMGLRCTCWWMAAVLQQAVEIGKNGLASCTIHYAETGAAREHVTDRNE